MILIFLKNIPLKTIFIKRVAGSSWRAPFRGLKAVPETLKRVAAAADKLRATLSGKVMSTLESWRLRARKQNDVTAACVAHAHLAHLYYGVDCSQLDERAATTLLSAQAFLNLYYRFTVDLDNDKVQTEDDLAEPTMPVGGKSRSIPLFKYKIFSFFKTFFPCFFSST